MHDKQGKGMAKKRRKKKPLADTLPTLKKLNFLKNRDKLQAPIIKPPVIPQLTQNHSHLGGGGATQPLTL